MTAAGYQLLMIYCKNSKMLHICLQNGAESSKWKENGPQYRTIVYICLSEQLKLLEVQLADTFKGSSPSLAQIIT